MYNINITFGGFYNSTHSNLIDNMVENYYSDNMSVINHDLIFDLDNSIYQELNNKYINHYVDFLNEFINDNYDLDINFHDVALDSPRFYNYSTDTILTRISNDNVVKLYEILAGDAGFKTFLQDATKRVSGYISFYTYDEVLKDKDNILGHFLINYIVQEIITTDDWLQYYDMENCYEDIYSIDNLPERV